MRYEDRVHSARRKAISPFFLFFFCCRGPNEVVGLSFALVHQVLTKCLHCEWRVEGQDGVAPSRPFDLAADRHVMHRRRELLDIHPTRPGIGRSRTVACPAAFNFLAASNTSARSSDFGISGLFSSSL